MSVEELALQYYARSDWGGWQGCHSESEIWHTMFGLLMWDTIFSSKKKRVFPAHNSCADFMIVSDVLCATQDHEGVFRTPFQSCPLDLTTDAFYQGRKDRIERQLKRIHDGEQATIAQKTWNQHCGSVCEGVNWHRHTLKQLMQIMDCVGGPALAGICKLFAEDYKGWSGDVKK